MKHLRARADRDRHHRRRPGRPGHRLPPAAARPAVPHPGRQPAGRRQLAGAVGHAAPLHPGRLRRPAGPAVPRTALVLPDQGRGGRLPRRLRRPVRAPGPHRRPGRPAGGHGRRLRAADRHRDRAGRERGGGDRARSAGRRTSPTSRSSSTPRSASCTPASTAGRPSSGPAGCWSSAPRTPAPTSPTSWRPRTRRCWPGGTPGRCRSGWTTGAPGSSGRSFLFLGRHLITRRTPIGRKEMAEVRFHGGPMIRVKRADLAARGVERVPARVTGVRNGRPVAGGPRARRRHRDLVHRLPPGLRLDRPADPRSGRLAAGDAGSGRRGARACSSAASPSSTRSARWCWPGSAGTRTTSRGRSASGATRSLALSAVTRRAYPRAGRVRR